MAVDHYENFPVASILMPKKLRDPIHLIYQFARQADDFADEGDLAVAERLALLANFRAELDRIKAGQPSQHPLFIELARVIQTYQLPLLLFYDLLDAFTQDVTKKRYANFNEVMDYCRRSANPVGRLLLHLFNQASPVNLTYSDSICSSLQLINFWQDIAIDYQKDRIYLPLDEMAQYGVTELDIAEARTGTNWRALMHHQLHRTQTMLDAGAPLGKALSGRIGLEIRMIIQGGNRILNKLRACRGDVFQHRPILKPLDWIMMFYRAIIG